MTNIDRICLITDFLREPYSNNKSDAINKNCIWFNTLFGDLLKEVTKLPIEKHDFDSMEDFAKRMYEIYGYKEPYSENDWLSLYNETLVKDEALELFEKYFSNSLVLGFELPLIFRNIFDKMGVVYIDVIHHPIRYLDDLLHGFSTNSIDLYKSFMKYQVNPDVFKLAATSYKVKSRMRNENCGGKANSCVIFGQTSCDRSIIKKDNTLAKILDYKEQLEELAKTYDCIYFKPHPANKNNEEVINYLLNFDNFSLLGDINTYDLYCDENIKLYLALSSGTLYEAKYFGNNIQYLFKQPFEYGEDYITKDINTYDFKKVFVSVYKEYFTFSFWSEVLSCIIETKDKEELVKVHSHNNIRYALRAAWGFNDNRFISTEEIYHGNSKIKLNLKNKIRYKIFGILFERYKNVDGRKNSIIYRLYRYLYRILRKKGIIIL